MKEEERQQSAKQIQELKKYRNLEIPIETILGLIETESRKANSRHEILKRVRGKLHNIIAPYLDSLNYGNYSQLLNNDSGKFSQESIRSLCISIMSHHDSTRERLPYLSDFYEHIHKISPNPKIVLDLACGLNPFALPFMNLPETTTYLAFDIHSPRVQLINQFFNVIGQSGNALVRDILISPPSEAADLVFFFKEAHRMEKRSIGASREIIKYLRGKVILLSLPNKSLDGKRNLSSRMRRLAIGIFEGEEVREIEFPGETIYWVRREDV